MMFNSCLWWGKVTTVFQKCFWREKENTVAFYFPMPIDHADNLGKEGCYTPAPCEHQPLYHSYGTSSFSALSGWHTMACNPGAHHVLKRGGNES